MRPLTDRFLRLVATSGILFASACSSGGSGNADAGQDVVTKADTGAGKDSGTKDTGAKDTGTHGDATSKPDVGTSADTGTKQEASTGGDSGSHADTGADSGSSKDSGAQVDAGHDSGEETHDAGHDSGVKHDAGHDSGVDSGSPIDSGEQMFCMGSFDCKAPPACVIVTCETVGSNPEMTCVYKNAAQGTTCTGGTCNGSGKCQ
jgi:hypothetical protein